MYNYVTNYFKKCRFNKTTPVFNITKLKALFSEEKKNISKWSTLEFDIPNTKTKQSKKQLVTVSMHLLDYAINDAVNRFESCLTNFKNGHIKHFRLRYLKMSKPNKIMKIEKLAFQRTGFYTRSLGSEMKCNIDNFNYVGNIITVATLKYENNNFKLLIKYKVANKSNQEQYLEKTNTIAFDPGVRVFLTGYSNKGSVEISTDQNKIKDKLQQIDSIMNKKKFTDKKKNKLKNKKYEKIKNRTKDCHWKIIKYITENYKNVIIGNLSTKKIGELDSKNKMTKRIANMYSLYKFKERLKYKTKYTNTNYKETDEAYTTQCCSNCCYRHEDIGSNKIFSCPKCGLVIGRDLNSSKNMIRSSL